MGRRPSGYDSQERLGRRHAGWNVGNKQLGDDEHTNRITKNVLIREIIPTKEERTCFGGERPWSLSGAQR